MEADINKVAIRQGVDIGCCANQRRLLDINGSGIDKITVLSQIMRLVKQFSLCIGEIIHIDRVIFLDISIILVDSITKYPVLAMSSHIGPPPIFRPYQ